MKTPEKRLYCEPVLASMWAQTDIANGKTVKSYCVSIKTVYKDREGWEYMRSFRVEDLPKVALLANEAYKYARLQEDPTL